MKAISFTLFIVAVSAAPLPKDNDAVEMIVNGVPDGAALEVGHLVDIKLKEHAEGGVVSTDLLHPYTAVGLAEAQAAAAAAAASSNSHEVSVVDSDNAIARSLTQPENPQPILEAEQLPVAAPQSNGKVYNDGLVQVQYNGPQDPGMLATLQDWFNVVVNYFNSANIPAAPAAPAAALQPRH